MCLFFTVIRILPQDQHLYIVIGGEMERREDIFFGWKDLRNTSFLLNEPLEFNPIRFSELVPQERIPVGNHSRILSQARQLPACLIQCKYQYGSGNNPDQRRP